MVEITTEENEGIHFITVDGEIDAGSSIHLDNALKGALKNGFHKIIVDLTDLRYISSAGLGVFISHLDEFEEATVQLVLFGINETVQEVFEILGLQKLLTIVATKEEAIEALHE